VDLAADFDGLRRRAGALATGDILADPAEIALQALDLLTPPN
jgi:hypothetical protein